MRVGSFLETVLTSDGEVVIFDRTDVEEIEVKVTSKGTNKVIEVDLDLSANYLTV